MNVVDFGVSDIDKDRNGTVNFHHSVKLDGSFGSLVGGPGEKTQAQIDGGSVQRVNSSIEVHSKIGVGVQWTGDIDQSVCKVGIDSPIAPLVGIGQRGASDPSLKTAVIELGTLCSQAGFDIAQAVAIRQLDRGHGRKLIPTRKLSNAAVAVVSVDAATEFVVREELHNLGKNGLSLIHTDYPQSEF